ncbi:gliding motility-associated C-terminal domain-containing protein [Bacteroidota bacterium]
MLVLKREYLFTIFIIIFILVTRSSFSQTSISGIINSYTAIDSIYPSKDTVEVADPSAFNADDTVMIYQAQGAEPVTDIITNPYNFGSVRTSDLNETGKYEIILVQKVEANMVIFKSFLNNDYNTNEKVQLVRVPSYKSVSVDGEITCEAWEGSKGGILALMVSDTLFLNADINVMGKGFRGATPFESNGECSSTDSATYGTQYFSESTITISAGFKGEGVAKFDTAYRKGLGRWANGGGGGNARFSGGGGGGNDGNGGYGGQEDTVTCTTPAYDTNPDYDGFWNALGGSDGFGLGKQNFVNDSTIFMGGGGGSGTYTTGLTATNGGNGGGLVIIIAKIIKSGGNSIIASGSSVSSIAEASGGGGGAGGTVVFDIDSVIGALNVSTSGGSGGIAQAHGQSGPGGGGGGGPVLWNSTRPSNVTLMSEGGDPGYAQNLWPDIKTHEAKKGSFGTEKPNVKVPLTGFLFNSVTSDQQVCMDGIPDLISGSEPRGGTGNFTFQWQQRTNLTAYSDIPGATSRDYQPPALTDTTYYKRIVTSGSVIDNGNEVEVIVHDYVIGNNILGDDLIICVGNEADTITGTEVILGGNNISYQYIWESSIDQNAWNPITLLNDTVCLPGIVIDTTYVRRVVISGACYDTTANIEIIGLPEISNNVLSPDQEICEGQIPDEIVGGAPGNGDGSYTIYWEDKTESSGWITVTDSIRKDLAPSNLFETMYYRRTVQSDDCFDISDTIKINVLVPIADDSIITQSKIYTCYNTAPQTIEGSTPTGGDGSYSYQWQESTNGIAWSNIITNATNKDYLADALTQKTYYRRIVTSGINDCCSSITDTIEVDIYALPIATIADVIDTTCSGEEVILDIDFSAGETPFTLTFNNGEADFTPSPIDALIYNPGVNPTATIESKQYNYTIVSVSDDNGCEATDMTGLTNVTVYGIPSANAGIDDEVCILSYQISATPSLGTGEWTQLTGIGNTMFESNTSANTNLTVDIAGEYEYLWKETNWQCQDSDTTKITLFERPFNINVNPEDTILYFVDELELKGTFEIDDNVKPVVTTWDIIVGSADDITSIENDSIITFTSLNDLGNEEIIITWTVEREECEDSVVNVSVKLRELFTPTGFTPNGDGVNDRLTFNGLENSDENKLIIYNRWGTEVFSKKNFTNSDGWDGKNNGKELPEDTYFYILTVTDDGVSQTHKGFIVLKRF